MDVKKLIDDYMDTQPKECTHWPLKSRQAVRSLHADPGFKAFLNGLFTYVIIRAVNENHVFVWINAENVDDVAVFFISPTDADKIRDAIRKHEPETLTDMKYALDTEKIPNLMKTWGPENKGFDVFEFDQEREDPHGKED